MILNIVCSLVSLRLFSFRRIHAKISILRYHISITFHFDYLYWCLHRPHSHPESCPYVTYSILFYTTMCSSGTRFFTFIICFYTFSHQCWPYIFDISFLWLVLLTTGALLYVRSVILYFGWYFSVDCCCLIFRYCEFLIIHYHYFWSFCFSLCLTVLLFSYL